MPRKTINVCGHCNEHKAINACVICDKDLCDQHTTGSIRDAYLVNRSKQYRYDHRPDMVLVLGPFCPDCVSAHHYAIEDPHREFHARFKIAAQNVGNAIARELFRDREEV